MWQQRPPALRMLLHQEAQLLGVLPSIEKAATLLSSRCLQSCVFVLATLPAVLTALLAAVQPVLCLFLSVYVKRAAALTAASPTVAVFFVQN